VKHDTPIRPKFNVSPRRLWIALPRTGTRQESPIDQFAPDGNIKASVGASGEVESPLQDLKCAWTNRDWAANGAAVEPAYIALPFMKAHQAMHRRYFRERCIDGSVRLRNGQAFDSHVHHGAEPWLRALNDRTA
jgi:hypothetical protein